MIKMSYKPFVFHFSLCIIAVLFTACTGRTSSVTDDEPTDSIAFKYARLIHVHHYDGYSVATIDNPWKAGAPLHTYVLLRDGEEASPSRGRLEGTTPVHVPLSHSVIFTSVHAALVEQLHAESQVAGVADLKYIKVPFVQQGVADGRLLDCGDGMAPVIEKIIDAQADAILLSPFENSGGYGRMEDIGIPLIECAEYMEQSPLARAEWMRFYGLLFGCEARADSLFAVVDSSYHALCQQAQTSTTRRSVLVDKQTGSVWYVPGGRSLSLPFEAVLEKAGASDVWLLRYDSRSPLTLPQLLKEQPGYRQLHPVRSGEVYGCNVMTSMFYEESPFRPDLLLQDFIHILHPDLTGSLPPLRYYHKISEE